MNILRTVTIVSSLVLLPSVCLSEKLFESGLLLQNQCNVDSDFYIACVGYIEAISDASQCGYKVNGYSSSVPENASRKQVVQVVLKWLGEHPEALHYNASGLVAAALQNAFPCK